MRWDEFEKYLLLYDFSKAKELATIPMFKGGWEVWLQVELAYHLSHTVNRFIIERELQYWGSTDRTDFVIADLQCGDKTYIELKCINPDALNPQATILGKYYSDLVKVKSKMEAAGCMLVYRCALNGKTEEKEMNEIKDNVYRTSGYEPVHVCPLGDLIYLIYCEPRKNYRYVSNE